MTHFQQFEHEIWVSRFLKAGVTREKAKKVFAVLFDRYGHFRNDGLQPVHDALKTIAYFI